MKSKLLWGAAFTLAAGLIAGACSSAAPVAEPTQAPASPAATALVAEPTQAPAGPAATAPPAPAQSQPTALNVGYEVGDRVPDVEIILDGTTVDSDTLLEAGQPTFLFFFATW